MFPFWTGRDENGGGQNNLIRGGPRALFCFTHSVPPPPRSATRHLQQQARYVSYAPSQEVVRVVLTRWEREGLWGVVPLRRSQRPADALRTIFCKSLRVFIDCSSEPQVVQRCLGPVLLRLIQTLFLQKTAVFFCSSLQTGGAKKKGCEALAGPGRSEEAVGVERDN